MLVVDEKLLEIDAQVDVLVAEFLKKPEVAHYRQVQADFLADSDLQAQIQQAEELQDYGDFRPEIRKMQQQILQNDKVYALKLAENDLQALLSALTKTLAGAISENIFIDENLPLKGGSRHERHHRKA